MILLPLLIIFDIHLIWLRWKCWSNWACWSSRPPMMPTRSRPWLNTNASSTSSTRESTCTFFLHLGPNIPSMASPNASASRTKKCSTIASISCSTSPIGVNSHSSVRYPPKNFCSRSRGCSWIKNSRQGCIPRSFRLSGAGRSCSGRMRIFFPCSSSFTLDYWGKISPFRSTTSRPTGPRTSRSIRRLRARKNRKIRKSQPNRLHSPPKPKRRPSKRSEKSSSSPTYSSCHLVNHR